MSEFHCLERQLCVVYIKIKDYTHIAKWFFYKQNRFLDVFNINSYNVN